MITEISVRLCPDCGSKIVINHTDKTIKFTGQPGFCLCHLSEEDAEEFGDLSDYGKEVN